MGFFNWLQKENAQAKDNKTDFDKKMDRSLDDLDINDVPIRDIYEDNFEYKGYKFYHYGRGYGFYTCRPIISTSNPDYDKIKTYYFIKPYDPILVNKFNSVLAKRQEYLKQKNISAFDRLLEK